MQTSQGGGLLNLYRGNIAVPASLGSQEPYSPALIQAGQHIHEPVHQVAVLGAPPYQHAVYNLLVILVQQFRAGNLFQVPPKLKINIVVIAKLLDEIPILETKGDNQTIIPSAGFAHSRISLQTAGPSPHTKTPQEVPLHYFHYN